MTSKPIIKTLLALPHYPNKDPYSLADLDVLNDIVTAGILFHIKFLIVSQKESAPIPPADAESPQKGNASKELKDIIISALYHKKMFLEATSKKEISFAITRDQLIYIFITLMTLTTGILFIASPSEYWPKWYCIAVVVMLLARICDYTQKKEHFFLIDFCYTAGIQILYFLICRPHSIHLATRTFAFGAGVLGWSTALFSNGLAIHRLDEFCSLWIHTVPSLMAYCLRWTNEKSVIYYETAPFQFGSEHILQYYVATYAPYFLWVAGYYFIINKIFKHLTVEGDYMTLVKFLQQKSEGMAKLLDIFGPKYRGESFMLWHVMFFSACTAIGYACFFNRTLHTISLCICVGSSIINGAKTLVTDLARPYQTSIEKINTMLAALG